MVVFKHFEIRLKKVGKILKHTTKADNKEYPKSKIYLHDNEDVGKKYELYDLGEVKIEECLKPISGKGILIFIPEKDRPKKHIGFGG